MEDEKIEKLCSSKEYTPHQLRSRPLRCITLPAICVLIFIAYWLIICPILYVSFLYDSSQIHNSDWPHWWPFAFWVVALIVFVIILSLIVCYWRCLKERQRNKEIVVAKYEYDSLMPKNPNQLYHVSLIDTGKETQQNNDYNKENSDNEKSNKKEKPKLNIENRPLSQISIANSVPQSPLTPRELFFLDLIEASNTSPAAFIPATNTFLYNERRVCLPEDITNEKKVPTTTMRQNSELESEFFIANVANRKSLTSEVFLFIDGGKEVTKYKMTKCDPADDY